MRLGSSGVVDGRRYTADLFWGGADGGDRWICLCWKSHCIVMFGEVRVEDCTEAKLFADMQHCLMM